MHWSLQNHKFWEGSFKLYIKRFLAFAPLYYIYLFFVFNNFDQCSTRDIILRMLFLNDQTSTCLPSLWLVPLLIKLYLITPVIAFACLKMGFLKRILILWVLFSTFLGLRGDTDPLNPSDNGSCYIFGFLFFYISYQFKDSSPMTTVY